MTGDDAKETAEAGDVVTAEAEVVEPIKPQDAPLNRADILAVDDHHHQSVRVPEWDGFVYMRAITAKERDVFDLWSVTNDGVNVRAHLVHLAICDEDGKAIFTVADVEAIGEKNSRVIDRLFDVAAAINGIGPQELAELEGN